MHLYDGRGNIMKIPEERMSMGFISKPLRVDNDTCTGVEGYRSTHRDELGIDREREPTLGSR